MSRHVLPPTSAEILTAYGLHVGELRRHGSGWESVGWTDGLWFVKAWRDQPPGNLASVEQIRLDESVPIAQLTVEGERFAISAAGNAYGVFEFFHGRHATVADWRETSRSLRNLHEHPLVDLPTAMIDETSSISDLRDRLGHPWINQRGREVEQYLDRLESAIVRATRQPYEPAIVHNDFGGWNLLVDQSGTASAILDWDHACIGPREHDVWIAFEHPDPVAFLRAYGAHDLDPVRLEYALLSRAVRDLAARVVSETDREGVEVWGFGRWRRLDADLKRAAPFLAS